MNLRAFSVPYLQLYLYIYPPHCSSPPCHGLYLHSPSHYLYHSNKCTCVRVIHTHTRMYTHHHHQIYNPLNADRPLDVKVCLLDHTDGCTSLESVRPLNKFTFGENNKIKMTQCTFGMVLFPQYFITDHLKVFPSIIARGFISQDSVQSQREAFSSESVRYIASW